MMSGQQHYDRANKIIDAAEVSMKSCTADGQEWTATEAMALAGLHLMSALVIALSNATTWPMVTDVPTIDERGGS